MGRRLTPRSVKLDPMFDKLFLDVCREYGLDNRSTCLRILAIAFVAAHCEKHPEKCRLLNLRDYEEFYGWLAGMISNTNGKFRKPEWLERDDTMQVIAEAVAKVQAIDALKEVRDKVRELERALNEFDRDFPGVLLDPVSKRIHPIPVTLVDSNDDDGMSEGVVA